MTEQPAKQPGGQRRKVLILTADAGFGHRTAANAVASALEELYGEECEVIILNPLEDRRTPFFLRDSQSDYDKLVRNMPELYRFGYDASDASVPAVIAEQALIVLLFEVMRDIVRTYHPNVILSTYPLYQAPLSAVLTVQRFPIPILLTITDLATVHRLWFTGSMDRCMVPTPIVRDLAINYGIPPEQVFVTGIPVNPDVVREHRSATEIRRDLGWDEDLLTVLAVGSRRVDRLVDTLNVLNHFGRQIQIVVVAGKDEKLFRELEEMEWHVPVRLYDFVSNVPTLMKAADFIVCKAGGLVVTESLACGKPMLIIDAIPGQETGNADYVVQNGAGDLAREPVEVLETISHWLMNDGELLRERTQNARLLGKPQAAYDVANAVWQAAQSYQPEESTTRRRRLVDLLTRNHVRWEEETTSSQGE